MVGFADAIQRQSNHMLAPEDVFVATATFYGCDFAPAQTDIHKHELPTEVERM